MNRLVQTRVAEASRCEPMPRTLDMTRPACVKFDMGDGWEFSVIRGGSANATVSTVEVGVFGPGGEREFYDAVDAQRLMEMLAAAGIGRKVN